MMLQQKENMFRGGEDQLLQVLVIDTHLDQMVHSVSQGDMLTQL